VREADGTYLPGVRYQLRPVTLGGVCGFSRRLPDGYFGEALGRVVSVRQASPEPLVTLQALTPEEEERYWEEVGRAPYRLKLLTDKGVREGGTFVTRAPEVGSLLNIPVGPEPDKDNVMEPTKGHVWRVVAVEDQRVLALEYVRAWEEGQPRCCD